MSGANVDFSVNQKCHYYSNSNSTTGNEGNDDETSSCKHFKISDAFVALLFLFGGCLSWAISSGKQLIVYLAQYYVI